MNFTEQYSKELFDRIDSYRNEILEYLKSTNNHYGCSEINFNVNDININYYRWMHPYQGDWEVESLFNETKIEYTKKLIKPNSVVLDIGAHTGNMSVAYSMFADKVISFEPNPSTFEVLQNNSKLNSNIIPYNFGCSLEEGEMEFHYSDVGFNNGGLATDLDSGIGVTGHNVPIEVYCVNVDNLMKELHSDDYNNISFIKIDCEGHDKVILPTLKNIIEMNKPIIQTEIYDGLSYNEKIELIEVIDSLNYDCYNFTEANDDIDALGSKITRDSVGNIDLLSGHNLICFHRGDK
tara:strand:+ start:3580 stop:4458 length:879 start_codon:yes stop_codon:yes gene_type:complete